MLFFNNDEFNFKIEEKLLNEYDCFIYDKSNVLIKKYFNIKGNSFQVIFEKIIKELNE